jgi:hypothetical protein
MAASPVREGRPPRRRTSSTSWAAFSSVSRVPSGSRTSSEHGRPSPRPRTWRRRTARPRKRRRPLQLPGGDVDLRGHTGAVSALANRIGEHLATGKTSPDEEGRRCPRHKPKVAPVLRLAAKPPSRPRGGPGGDVRSSPRAWCVMASA